jgi:ABC-2 type transport system ATP-binding protein
MSGSGTSGDLVTATVPHPAAGLREAAAGHGRPLAVRTRGLTKRYGRHAAVDGLDLEIPAGVVAGFVGPNGAGKTTTLRMLLGLVRPTAGEGSVLGASLARPASYLRRVGALIESPAFYPGLSGSANLRVQATVGGLDSRQIPAVLERVDLADRGDDPYRTYSLGMKQRLAIAAALLGDPALLILDEPTNGLDPAGIREMRGLVRSLAADGPTVLISSHLLVEVQQVCNWLVVIKAGRRLFQGSVEQILDGGHDELVLGCEHPADLSRLGELLARHGLAATRDGVRLRALRATRPTRTRDTATGQDEWTALLARINRAAAAEDITLVELTVRRSSLEDRYEELMSGGTR